MGLEGSIPPPSAYGSMVKRKSCRASNAAFQVQILVELQTFEKLNEMEGLLDWRWEPVGSRSSKLKMPCGFDSRSFRWKNDFYGVRGVAVSARLPVKQEVWVQLPSVTL